MRPGQEVERDLASYRLVGEVELVLVPEQDAEHVLRQLVLVQLTGGELGECRPAALDPGVEELLPEAAEGLDDLGLLGRLVTGVVGERGPLDEDPQVVEEVEALLGRAQRPIDPGGQRREVHHQLVAE